MVINLPNYAQFLAAANEQGERTASLFLIKRSLGVSFDPLHGLFSEEKRKKGKHVIDAASRLSCQRALCSCAILIIKQLFIKQKLTRPSDIFHIDTRSCRRGISS